MAKSKKYRIVGMFSAFSSIRWNDERPTRQPLTANREDIPPKKDPTEMQIDELFSRFAASSIRRNDRRE